MLILLAVYFLVLIVSILAVVKPVVVNRGFRRVLCAVRIMKRARLGTPIPRWRNILTAVIGVLLIAGMVWDLCDVQVGRAPSSVAVWESPTAGTLDADTRKAIDKEAFRLIRSAKSVGLVVGVVDGDKSAVLGYGRKSFRSSEPPDGSTLFEIGSIGKTFTALCLAAMIERGEVKLDDRLSLYLPGSVHLDDYNGRHITLSDLAMHTSGLPSVPGTLHWIKDNPYATYTDEMMYKFLNKYQLTRSPGKAHEYSNMGMGLLGLGLSRKRGTSYNDMVGELIREPLNMPDTVIKPSKEQMSRLADGYLMQGRIGGIDMVEPSVPWTAHECFQGCGDLRSTGNDMLNYLRANMGVGSNAKALPFEMIQKRRLRVDTLTGMWIGLGWLGFGKDYDDGVVWHNGESGGYRSFMAFSRKRGKGIVILSNSTEDGDAIDDAGFKLLVSMAKKD